MYKFCFYSLKLFLVRNYSLLNKHTIINHKVHIKQIHWLGIQNVKAKIKIRILELSTYLICLRDCLLVLFNITSHAHANGLALVPGPS